MTKGKVKPTSVRIPENLLEKIDTICNDTDCSRNDYITSVLDDAVNNEIDEIDDQVIKDTKPEPKPTLEKIEEPKPTLTLIDEPKKIDNSNKPAIEMVLFNGKYIPKVEVYEI